MDWSWLPPVTLIGAILLFVTNVWKLSQEHSSIRRLERLVTLRTNLDEGSDSLILVDQAIRDLAIRAAKRERPRQSSDKTLWGAAATASALSIVIALVFWAANMAEEKPVSPMAESIASLAALVSALIAALVTLASMRQIFRTKAQRNKAREAEDRWFERMGSRHLRAQDN